MESEYGIRWGDALYQGIEQKDYLIENFLYEKDIMCIKSKEGVGKSILAQQLLFALTSGQDFLDTYHVNKKCRVLWIQTEGDNAETVERITAMKRGLDLDDAMWAHLPLAGASMNTPRGMAEVRKQINKPGWKFDVIIIDPLYTTIQGKLTEDSVVSDWAREVRSLKDEHNATLIVLHHENKSMYFQGAEVNRKEGDVFGAFGWGAFFNTVYKLSVKNGVHTLKKGKDRSAKLATEIKMKMIEPVPLMFTSEAERLDVGSALIEKYIRDSDNVTRKQVIVKFGQELSESTVDRSLKMFKNNGTLEKFRDDGQWKFRWI